MDEKGGRHVVFDYDEMAVVGDNCLSQWIAWLFTVKSLGHWTNREIEEEGGVETLLLECLMGYPDDIKIVTLEELGFV